MVNGISINIKNEIIHRIKNEGLDIAVAERQYGISHKKINIWLKAKLIILNGPLGSGKSTLALHYAVNHPITLNLDIDHVRPMLSHWREQKGVSGPLAKNIALSMAKVALSSGHDVIVPQILHIEDFANSLKVLAAECGSSYYEILLNISKDEAVNRFIKRSKDQGHSTGFDEGGIIATSGREAKLITMYDSMMAIASKRSHVIRIDPIFNNIEATYNMLLKAIS